MGGLEDEPVWNPFFSSLDSGWRRRQPSPPWVGFRL
jgi:hypothetical protein